ncbi:MAG: hypothetical protein BWY72_02111 [Bacteroidetes bacterium ADurb.Bin416]|nr:MAG: hypothetical protein BWY72_02111 [Bacteroidetes bacterium ADurb.Bin416]
MSIQASTAYLVSTRLGNNGMAKTSQQGTDHHDRTSKGRALFQVVGGIQPVQVKVVSLETPVVSRQALRLDTQTGHQVNQVADVQDIGNVLQHNLLTGEQDGAQHLQGLIFGSLGFDGTGQLVSAFN